MPVRQLTLSLVLFFSLGALAEDRADAPRGPRGPEPSGAFRADDDDQLRPALPGAAASSDPRDDIRRDTEPIGEMERSYAERALAQKVASPEIGGDDVFVRSIGYLTRVEIDIANDGTIYMAIGHNDGFPEPEWIEIYRSQDGGTTFQWLHSILATGSEYDRLYDINVIEGVQSKVYVTYMHYNSTRGGFDFQVRWAVLSSGAMSWSTRTIMNTPGVSFLGPDLASDADAFSAYYLYAVCAGLDGNGDDIFFSRSTDYGETWSAPYRMASLTASGNLMYSRPHVAYGSGGYVQVAWTYTERLQSTFDDTVRYRRAVNYATNSTDWDPTIWALYPTDDGIDQVTRDLESSASSAVTAIFSSNWINAIAPRVFASYDGGATWSYVNEDPLAFDRGVDAYLDAANSRIVAFGTYAPADADDELAMIEAPLSNLHSGWTAPRRFSNALGYVINSPSIAIDPSRGNRVAVGWQGSGNGEYQACFDAEWHADEGYPNYDTGFPVAIPSSASRTAPALVNVDADIYDEIVFASTDGNVHVYSHLGTVPGGWPRDIGAIGFRTQVAVGDLNGDGQNEIVAGNTTGQVYCFDGAGNTMPGFPVDLATGATAHVSIGLVGPFYPNWIVVLSGNRVARINYRGEVFSPSFTLSGVASSAAAIGDVDDDGDAEIVDSFAYSSGGSFVHVIDPDFTGVADAFRWFTSDPAGSQVSLGDLDGDGDLEICHPTANGKLYVLQHDLSDLAGFPFDNGSGVPVSPVSLDQMLGAFAPELIFNSQDARVHVLYATGVQQTAFPAATGPGWNLFGGSIVAPVLGANNWVITGSRDSKGHAFRNVGAIEPAGWPKPLYDQIEVTPATGDIDKDGLNEIVFVGNGSLHAIQTGIAPGAVGQLSWPMHGANARRTSCMDCAEDSVTPAPELASTRVSFRLSSENPSRGRASFAASVPSSGVLSLEIYDLRGRRARLVSRREVAAGPHTLHFDGLDDAGKRMARGHYFARLVFQGAGYRETAVERLVLVD